VYQFFKWKSVRRWHKKEKQKYEQSLKIQEDAGKQTSPMSKSNNSASVPGELSDVDVGCTGPGGELLQHSASSVPVSEVPGKLPSNIYE
jgi:hypothetical protein